MKTSWKALMPLIAGLAVLFVPVPQGLEPFAWHYFALFVAVVVALVLEPIPGAMAGLVAVTVGAALQLVPPKPGEPVTTGSALSWALAGFTNGTVWLIFAAFMFAKGYEKTGLGRRISLVLMKFLGKSTLGLGYAVALADLILAPFIPSNTARSGGTIFPIVENIPALYGCTPDNEPRKIGAYLMWTAFTATCITSSMFLTALAPNLLALSLVEKGAGVTFTWMEWFKGFLPVGAILFVTTPYIIYKIYPPTLKKSPDAPAWAKIELEKMGALSPKEIIMGLLALTALALWIFGGAWFKSTTVALIVLCLMVLTGAITWDDILSNKQAWNVLVWFATLVTLAGGLKMVGFLDWFAKSSAGMLAGMTPISMVVMLVVIFFVVHYMFASITAHVTALLPVMLAAAVSVPGMPVRTLAMLLCATLGLMGVISPYATGPGPIYYGSGYISRTAFWMLGFIFGVIFLSVLLGVGVPWIFSLKG